MQNVKVTNCRAVCYWTCLVVKVIWGSTYWYRLLTNSDVTSLSSHLHPQNPWALISDDLNLHLCYVKEFGEGAEIIKYLCSKHHAGQIHWFHYKSTDVLNSSQTFWFEGKIEVFFFYFFMFSSFIFSFVFLTRIYKIREATQPLKFFLK